MVQTDGGVGYAVTVPAGVAERLPATGARVSLHTELVVKEDGWALFGFDRAVERMVFQRLLGASGFGPKLALALLSALGPERTVRSILARDLAALSSVSGVGRRRPSGWCSSCRTSSATSRSRRPAPRAAGTEEAVQALVGLGYGPGAADDAVRAALGGRRTAGNLATDPAGACSSSPPPGEGADRDERASRDRRMELHPLRYHQPEAGARPTRPSARDRCNHCRAWHIVTPGERPVRWNARLDDGGPMTQAAGHHPRALPEETGADAALRPSRLDEFVGQAQVKSSLQIAIDAAKGRRETLDHTLFFGPPGLGKTTLAMLMAREMGVQLRTTSGPVLEKPGDLVGLLTSLGPGDMLFIDEIHRMKPALEEFLYPAMEDFRVDVRIADGPHAQTIPMALERFTLIGATTRFGLLTPPMRARFGLVERLGLLSARRAAADRRPLGVRSSRCPIDEAGAAEIARRSRGTPRVANRLLRRVRDYAQVKADGRINVAVAARGAGPAQRGRVRPRRHGRAHPHHDHREVRRRARSGSARWPSRSARTPARCRTCTSRILIQQGFLERTPRGRCATALAYRRFGLTPPPAAQATIFDG